jgi:DNA modification methylase
MKFQDFYEKYKSKYSEKVQLFLTDPPYNVLPNQRDRFTQGDMELLVKMAELFLTKGGTLLIFCAVDQISIYKQLLDRTILKVEPLIMNIINDEKCNVIN